MEIAFLMDPLGSINPVDDTTSHLMYACNQRGHTVYFLEPHDVYIRGGAVVARMRNVTVARDLSMTKYWQAMIRCLQKEELIFETVTDLDALFLRKKPPLNYQVMEFLGPVGEQVFIINSAIGQILGNSKLYTLNFPDISPETHVSRDPQRLKKIIDDFGGAMVVKPLQRYGGEGVIKVSTRDQENLASLIDYYVQANRVYPKREPIMVQAYVNAEKYGGHVRILMLNGEVLGALRRKSVPGAFKAGPCADGLVCRHDVTFRQASICAAVKDRLIKDGLYFVSLDLIGDQLVAINCACPGGIPWINRLDNVRLELKIVDFIENRLKFKAPRPEGIKRSRRKAG